MILFAFSAAIFSFLLLVSFSDNDFISCKNLKADTPISANAQTFRKGCKALGIRSTVAPLAILSAPFDGRPPCINRGFCNQGCMPNAKFSALIHHIPKAINNGAEVLSDSMVTRILVNNQGKVEGVEFNHDGQYFRQKAKIVYSLCFCC